MITEDAMPRKGIGICRRCKKRGCTACRNEKGEVIATCPHCGNTWKSKASLIYAGRLPDCKESK